MIAYSYDKVTKQYIGTRECQLDPLETKNAGHNIWLLPANSTFTAPPINKDGFNIIWNGTNWRYEEIYIEPELNPKLEPTLEKVKEAKIAELKQIRDTKELEPIEYAGHYYDFDLKSYNRITAAADVLDRAEIAYQQYINNINGLTPEELAYLEEINNTSVKDEENTTPESEPEQDSINDHPRPSIMWTTADNDNVELTADGLHGIIQAAATRSNELHVRYRLLKNAVSNASDIPAVQGITWSNLEDYI